MIRPEVNCYYQHRYGGLYRVQDIATSTVDNTAWVVYMHVYPFEFKTFIRPYDEWVDGRFKKISNIEYSQMLQKNMLDFRKEVEKNKKEFTPLW